MTFNGHCHRVRRKQNFLAGEAKFQAKALFWIQVYRLKFIKFLSFRMESK